MKYELKPGIVKAVNVVKKTLLIVAGVVVLGAGVLFGKEEVTKLDQVHDAVSKLSVSPKVVQVVVTPTSTPSATPKIFRVLPTLTPSK